MCAKLRTTRGIKPEKGKETHVVHESFANRTNLLREGGRKHHHLFVVGSLRKDALYIATHALEN